MKISVDDIELFTISETHLDVIANDIPTQELEDDLKRRLQWIIDQKYNGCFGRLKKEWDPKLIARGMTSLPVDKDEYAQLVFSQEDYMNRSERDAAAAQQ